MKFRCEQRRRQGRNLDENFFPILNHHPFLIPKGWTTTGSSSSFTRRIWPSPYLVLLYLSTVIFPSSRAPTHWIIYIVGSTVVIVCYHQLAVVEQLCANRCSWSESSLLIWWSKARDYHSATVKWGHKVVGFNRECHLNQLNSWPSSCLSIHRTIRSAASTISRDDAMCHPRADNATNAIHTNKRRTRQRYYSPSKENRMCCFYKCFLLVLFTFFERVVG